MPEKNTYCKNCGGLISNKTRKCTGCGRQYFRLSRRVAIVGALTFIGLVLIGLNVYQYVTNQQTLEKLNSNLVSMTATKDRYMSQNYDLAVQLSLKDNELGFWNEHAVIVTEEGEKYHHYGCYHLDDCSSIWIYNIEAAKSRGYTPCLDCCKENMTLSEYIEQNK